MPGSEDKPAQYQNIKVTVVEVCNGESREEAWRRYLAEHPESFGVDVKIFHYANTNHRSSGGKL